MECNNSLQLPDYFIKKVIRIFGNKGQMWLEDLPRIFNVCKEKWNLTNCILSKDLSMNFVCFAMSPDFGDVALKIGVPHTDLFTEIEALSLYGGKNICRCYDFDRELGAILLERVEPGIDLNNIKTNNERIKTGAELISKLPFEIDNCHGLPLYSNWIEEAFTGVRKKCDVSSDFLSFVDMAERYFIEIEQSSNKNVLLHGDLHHKNILKSGYGKWIAIDPKGVIGPKVMEASPFIAIEIEMTKALKRNNAIDYVTGIFSNTLEESKTIIAKSIFVQRVLGTAWKVIEYAKPGDLSGDMADCQFFYDYIRSLN